MPEIDPTNFFLAKNSTNSRAVPRKISGTHQLLQFLFMARAHHFRVVVKSTNWSGKYGSYSQWVALEAGVLH